MSVPGRPGPVTEDGRARPALTSQLAQISESPHREIVPRQNCDSQAEAGTWRVKSDQTMSIYRFDITALWPFIICEPCVISLWWTDLFVPGSLRRSRKWLLACCVQSSCWGDRIEVTGPDLQWPGPETRSSWTQVRSEKARGGLLLAGLCCAVRGWAQAAQIRLAAATWLK